MIKLLFALMIGISWYLIYLQHLETDRLKDRIDDLERRQRWTS